MTESGDDAVMNPPSELSQMMANSIGASVLALGGMVPALTGDGGGPSAKDFLEVLVQVEKMGGWNDLQLIGIGRCKMIGKAYNFAWHDEELKGAKTFKEFQNLVLARYDSEPLSAKMEKFLTARQERGEDVREFSSRLTALGKRTLISDSNSDVATYTGMNFLEVQLLAWYTNGLRDPIRRFVLSHDPKTFKETVEIATREERNESIVADNQPAWALREENDQVEDLRLRLDRL